MQIRFLLAVIISILLTTPSYFALAQSSGMSVTPHTVEEPADPGDVLTSAVTIKNLSEVTQTYYLFVRDIEGVTDTGRPLYANDTYEATDIDLSRWITLTKTEVTLAPEESEQVPFLVSVPENAPPGGHFAGIFGSLEAPGTNVQGAGAGVGYRVGNIINIRVSGDVVEQAAIRSFQTDKFVYGSKDVVFTARVENEGNVLIRPAGPLTVTNMLGDTVAELVMNDSRAGVFPNSIRPVTGEWHEAGLGFGRYTAAVTMVYGVPGEAQYNMTAGTAFWVLPWEIIRPLLITLVVLAIASYVLVRYYITQQVRKLSGGRRLIRTTNNYSGPSPIVLASIVMLFMTAVVLFVMLLLFA